MRELWVPNWGGDDIRHDSQCEMYSEGCGCESRIALRAEIEQLKRMIHDLQRKDHRNGAIES